MPLEPQLGIPTANLPVDEEATPWIATATSGVYFGYAGLSLPAAHPDHVLSASGASALTAAAAEATFHVYPMVMSIGYNPFYKNTVRSAEVHVLHRFAADFYGAPLRLLVCGFVRPERDYAGLDALVADINIDCDVARRSLARAAWRPREGVVVDSADAPDAPPGQTTVTGSLDGSWLVRPREPHTATA